MKSLKPYLLIIISLLVVIIAASMISNNALYATSKKLQSYVDGIEQNASSGRWEKASESLSSFEKDWSRTHKNWAMLLDHFEIDNIDTALSRVSRFVAARDTALTMGEAAVLKQFIQHIPEKESFKLANIF